MEGLSYEFVWRLILNNSSELLRCSKKTLELLLDAGYRVVTVSRGDEALSTLRHKKRKVDLVVTRTKLPDMCAFKLVQILNTKYMMTVVMICDNYNEPTILRGLLSGAMFCLSNPLCTEDIESLWQHVIRKRRLMRESCESKNRSVVAHEEFGIYEAKLLNSLIESSATGESSHTRKRKISDLEEVEGWVMGLPASFNWTIEFHWKLLEAVVKTGVDVAVPSEALRRICSPGLTIQYVNEKLQQNHLYLKGQQDLRSKRVIYNHDPSYRIAEQLMAQGSSTSHGLTYASERPPMTGFLQNPQDLLNATVFRCQADPPGVQEMPIPPMAFLGTIPASPLVLPDTLRLPPAPVPQGTYAQSSIQAPCSSTVAEVPSVIIASPVPGRGQAEGEQDVQIRG